MSEHRKCRCGNNWLLYQSLSFTKIESSEALVFRRTDLPIIIKGGALLAYRAFSRIVLRSILVLFICLPAPVVYAHCSATISDGGVIVGPFDGGAIFVGPESNLGEITV